MPLSLKDFENDFTFVSERFDKYKYFFRKTVETNPKHIGMIDDEYGETVHVEIKKRTLIIWVRRIDSFLESKFNLKDFKKV